MKLKKLQNCDDKKGVYFSKLNTEWRGLITYIIFIVCLKTICVYFNY